MTKDSALHQINDSLTNLVANLGTSKDKRSSSTFQPTVVSVPQLEHMYQYDWLSASIVDIPVNDMTRKWREFSDQSVDEMKIKQLVTTEGKLQTRTRFNDAKKWARLYGGAVILMGIDNTGEPEEPLDLNSVKQGSLKFLKVLDSNYVQPGDINTADPMSESYLMPESYSVNGHSVHHSRVLRFEGRRLPDRLMQQCNYWGASSLQTAYDAILNAQGTAAIIASLMYESKLDVISVPELYQELASPNGAAKISERFALADMIKSINNVLLLDDKETFDRKVFQFGGLSEIQKNYMLLASAAAKIPATRLFGQSANGLNASGDGQQDDYYDMVSSAQEDEFRPPLTKYDEVLYRSTLGTAPSEDFSFKFRPLVQLSELEQAQVDKTNAERDTLNVNMGAVDSVIVTKQLQAEGTYEALDDEYVRIVEGLNNTTFTGEE